MTVKTMLDSTLGIIDAAARVVEKSPYTPKVKTGLQIADRMAKTSNAITAVSSQTTILSRMFIDENIVNEPILPNLNRGLHSWYAAQCIAALHLSQMVDSQRSVQDVMSVVQTGHNARATGVVGHAARGVWGKVQDRRAGLESFLGNLLGEAAAESLGGALPVPSNGPAQPEGQIEKPKLESKSVSLRSINPSENRIGPLGELYEIKLVNPGDAGQTTTVPLFIQMQPSVIPAEVAPRFIDMNVLPSVWQRWTQMRSGELSFWKDFILNRDLIKRQRSVLKDPSLANAFSGFLKTVAKKDKYALDEATDHLGTRQSSNLANSVVIFSEDTVLQAKSDSGIDLHEARDRRRYFHETYAMILVIIDPLHQRLKVYFNGIDGDIDASYGEFRPKDDKFDPVDFMTALQSFSTNSMSRLR
jgi:hypothetical protein